MGVWGRDGRGSAGAESDTDRDHSANGSNNHHSPDGGGHQADDEDANAQQHTQGIFQGTKEVPNNTIYVDSQSSASSLDDRNMSDRDPTNSDHEFDYCPANYIILPGIGHKANSNRFHVSADDQEGDKHNYSTMQGDGTFQKTAYQIRRGKQKRASKSRTMERAKLALQAEKVGAMTWRPRRCIEIVLNIGKALQFRWQCEQFIRAYTAFTGVHKGVNISQTWEKVRMKFRNTDCAACMVFNWQPSTGLWKMNHFVSHCEDCSAHDESEVGSSRTRRSFCAPAYTPSQVARAILSEAASDPNISAKTIGSMVRAKQIYRRQPPDSHYRSVRLKIIRHMNASRLERGPASKKKRCYTCSICHQEGHTAMQCHLRQLFGDMQ